MTPSATATDLSATRLLVCLCAEWCNTCREYRPLLQEVAARHPAMQVRWIDIEDEADLVDDVDVETFPTLLIIDQVAGQGAQAAVPTVRFFGPLTPQAGTLLRLIESLDDGAPREATGLDSAVKALAQRLVGG